jgi:hypothetical protein
VTLVAALLFALYRVRATAGAKDDVRKQCDALKLNGSAFLRDTARRERADAA